MPTWIHPPEVLNSPKAFYVARGSENLGLFPLSVVLENIYENKFTFDHLYAREGGGEWLRLNEIFQELQVSQDQLQALSKHQETMRQPHKRLREDFKDCHASLAKWRTEPKKFKKIKAEIDKDIKKTQAEIPKNLDEAETKRSNLIRLEFEQEFLGAAHEGRDTEYAQHRISLIKEKIKYMKEMRRTFWKATFNEALVLSKKETLYAEKNHQYRIAQIIRGAAPSVRYYTNHELAMSEACRNIYSESGHKIKQPKPKEINVVLSALDKMDEDWELKDDTVFHRTILEWFPALKMA